MRPGHRVDTPELRDRLGLARTELGSDSEEKPAAGRAGVINGTADGADSRPRAAAAVDAHDVVLHELRIGRVEYRIVGELDAHCPPRFIAASDHVHRPETVGAAHHAALPFDVTAQAPQAAVVWVGVDTVNVMDLARRKGVRDFHFIVTGAVAIDAHVSAAGIVEILSEVDPAVARQCGPGTEDAARASNAAKRRDGAIAPDADTLGEGKEDRAVLQREEVVVEEAERPLSLPKPRGGTAPPRRGKRADMPRRGVEGRRFVQIIPPREQDASRLDPFNGARCNGVLDAQVNAGGGADAPNHVSFLQKNEPIDRTSMRVRAKQSIASAGVFTIGSFSLKLVLRTTGIPVRRSKARMRS